MGFCLSRLFLRAAISVNDGIRAPVRGRDVGRYDESTSSQDYFVAATVIFTVESVPR